MSRLSKVQKQKLDAIVKDKKLFVKVNKLLKQYGAGDLQLTELKVQSMNVSKPIFSGRTIKGNIANINAADNIANIIAATNSQPNFSVFPPICQHGIPMVEVCTIGGSCRWVCDHS